MRENGRSMVEMLGVLAIIGVLSVGAISGYSKAMMKYKLNKQTEQVSTILRALIRYQNDLRLNDGSTETYNVLPLLKKLNEIPEDMYITSGTSYTQNTFLQDVFKNQYKIYHHDTNYLGILVSLNDTEISVQSCKNLYIIGKEFRASLTEVLTRQQLEDDSDVYTAFYGDNHCTSGKKCLKNLMITDTDVLCRICHENKICYFYFIVK